MIGLKQLFGIVASLVILTSAAVLGPTGDESGTVALQTTSTGASELVAQAPAPLSLQQLPVIQATTSQGTVDPPTVIEGTLDHVELVASTVRPSSHVELGGEVLRVPAGSTITIEGLAGTLTTGEDGKSLVVTASGVADKVRVHPPVGAPISTQATSQSGLLAKDVVLDGTPLTGNHRSEGVFDDLSATLVPPTGASDASSALSAGNDLIEIDEEIPIQLQEYIGVVVTVQADGDHVLLRIDGFANATVGGTPIQHDASVEAELHPDSLGPDNQPPEAAFSWETEGGVPNVGQPIRFIDESDDDLFVSKWHWSFGDGDTSTERFPEHTYDQPGLYTVELTVSDAHGGSDSANATLNVRNPLPEIRITWQPSNPIEGEPVNLHAEVSDPDGGEIESIDWEISDGSTHHGADVVQTFDDHGTYALNVSAVDDEGDRAWKNTTLRIHNAPPTPAFVVIPESPTAGQPATLTSESFDPGDGEIVNTTWEVSGIDGPLYGHSVNVTFPRDGKVPVEITVTDDDGQSASKVKKVDVQNPVPQVTITHTPAIPNPDQPVSFVAQVQDDDLPESAAWTFPNGVTRTGMAVNVVFPTGGLKTVTVEVTDTDGAVGEATTEVLVNHAPLVNLTATSTTVATNETVTLSAVTSDPDGTVASTLWVVDGQEVADHTACDLTQVQTGLTDVVCSWEDDGEHTFTVTAADDDGATTSNTTTIQVTNRAPSLDPGIQGGHANEEETAIFQANATDPDGPESQINVTWQEDGEIVGFGQEIPLTYDEPQDVTLTVTATDEDGGSTTADLSFHVNAKPSVSIDGPTSVVAGTSATWTAQASDAEGNPLTYTWTVDGDTVGTNLQLHHTFPTGGTETLKVAVTDSLGATRLDSLDVRVTSPPLDLNVTVDDTTPLAGSEVTFTIDTNGRPIEGTVWTFDPVRGATTQVTTGAGVDTLSHTFESPRHVDVTAEVSSDKGSSATDRIEMRVRASTSFDIVLEPWLPDQTCLDHTTAGVSVTMSNQETGETLALGTDGTYTWTSADACILHGAYPTGTWSEGDGLGLEIHVGTGITSVSPGFQASGTLDLTPLDLTAAEVRFEGLELHERTNDGILSLDDDAPGTTYHDPTEDVELSGQLVWITGQPAQGREISLDVTYDGPLLSATAQTYAEWTEQSDITDGTFSSEVPKIILEGLEQIPDVEASYLPGNYEVGLTANGGPGTQEGASLAFTQDPEGLFGALDQPIP